MKLTNIMKQCLALKLNGIQCTYNAKNGSYCGHHNKNQKSQTEEKPTKISNKGERGEVCVIRKIFTLSGDDLVKIFGSRASNGVTVLDIETKKPLAYECIKKSKSNSKTDCLIKFNDSDELLYITIKCAHGSSPSILNHTPRSAKCFQKDGELHQYLNTLDKVITQINTDRYAKTVGEDIPTDKITIEPNDKEALIHVISYFMFSGTGSTKSKYPCNSILEVRNPENTEEWKFTLCDDEESKLNYIKDIYQRLIISMRDKGMPKKHTKMCEPWIYYQDNKDKENGSLHIRIKKS